MLNGIYNNAATLSSLERWQENISRNMSSSQTAGYKRTQFSLAGEEGGQTQPGATNASSSSTSMAKSVSRIDHTPGAIQRTDKPTDFAIDGAGFFQIQDTSGKTVYTRNGEFHFNNANTIVNQNGRPLLGEGGPIIIDPNQGPVSVAEDGSISQGQNLLGKIPLFDFPNGSKDLVQTQGGFLPKNGIAPTPVEKPSIVQGAIESSNVSAMTEMINLIMVSNAYQASQKLISSHDQLMGQAIQTLGAPPQG